MARRPYSLVFEVVLPRRVLRQPSPFIQPGGDCVACCVGALTDLSVIEVYTRFGMENLSGHPQVRDVLYQADRDGLLDRATFSMPVWPAAIPDWYASYGLASHWMATEWFDYLRTHLEAGMYGLAFVDMSKRSGPPDHAVLIVGARVRVQTDPTDGGRSFIPELLVSCSSLSTPDEEWVKPALFLRERGGYNLMFARPLK